MRDDGLVEPFPWTEASHSAHINAQAVEVESEGEQELQIADIASKLQT